MSSHLHPSRLEVPSGDLIFRLNAAAQQRAAGGASVINATVGALVDDNHRLVVLESVMAQWRQLTPLEIAPYAPITGDPEYLLALAQRCWPDLSGCGVGAAAPGGSGALTLSLRNLLEPGQTVVTAAPYWDPYAIIANEASVGLSTVPFPASGENLDIGAWEQTLRDVLDSQGRLLLWLNEPCHNPTGRGLSRADRELLLAVLRDLAPQGPVTLLLDLAYLDYARNTKEVEEALAEYEAFGKEGSVLVGASLSLSKAFTLYGSRAGALVFPWSSDKALQSALAASCRGLWSNCARAPMSVLVRFSRDETARKHLESEHAHWRKVLTIRAQALDHALKTEGLPGVVWEGGFFITLASVTDTPAVCDRLQKRDVFVVPVQDSLRVGICGLRADDAHRFATAYRESL